jgi:hypothetical protein
MLSEYDKHLIRERRKYGWGIHELAWNMREHHEYSYYKKKIEDFIEEEGL